MERRNFLRKTALAGGRLAVSSAAFARTSSSVASKQAPFKLKYAPHFGMFRNSAGNDPIDQIKFMHEQGFRALEDNGMSGRPVELQKKIGVTLEKLGMEMGVFVAHKIAWGDGNLSSGDAKKRAAFVSQITQSVEVAKRVNAKWMTVVPGLAYHRLQPEYQTVNVIEALKQAAAVLEPHNLVMVLEPLNFHNHPELFLTKIPQAYQICKAVGSPSCKILFDIYHQQIEEGNLIPNIDLAWSEIAYFQIGDNPGRKEPTTGEINYKNVFRHIHGKGFEGILGMEHGNFHKGKEGEEKLITAYRSCDPI